MLLKLNILGLMVTQSRPGHPAITGGDGLEVHSTERFGSHCKLPLAGFPRDFTFRADRASEQGRLCEDCSSAC